MKAYYYEYYTLHSSKTYQSYLADNDLALYTIAQYLGSTIYFYVNLIQPTSYHKETLIFVIKHFKNPLFFVSACEHHRYEVLKYLSPSYLIFCPSMFQHAD